MSKIAATEEPSYVTRASDEPSIRMPEGVVAYVKDDLGADIGVRLVKDATRSGELPCYVLSGVGYYSPKDVARWIASRRQASGVRPRKTTEVA